MGLEVIAFDFQHRSSIGPTMTRGLGHGRGEAVATLDSRDAAGRAVGVSGKSVAGQFTDS